MKRFLVVLIVIVGVLIGAVTAQSSQGAGDTDYTLHGSENTDGIQSRSTVEPRLLDRFVFPNDHAVEFRLLNGDARSVAIFETGQSGSESITGVRELADSSPSTVWFALNTDGRRIPSELVDLYGAPDSQYIAGWLGQNWLTTPTNSTHAGVCDNGWFESKVGTESAFPNADDHYRVFDRWGTASDSLFGGYYQYAYWVNVWHGGICLQDWVKTNENAAYGMGWYLWYTIEGGPTYPEELGGEYSELYYDWTLITPVFSMTPGGWGHWIWYKCGGCADLYWVQVAQPNTNLSIQFDMGMDWSF